LSSIENEKLESPDQPGGCAEQEVVIDEIIRKELRTIASCHFMYFTSNPDTGSEITRIQYFNVCD
jgi:hypothetical protein